MNKYKVSIIVPVYNTEDYLDRCLTSLTGQTLEEIQIVLVDDGSEDQSGIICDTYAAEDDRITVIHKENEGQGIARNAGLAVAMGEFVCFVDSDDHIRKNTCKRLYSIMKNSEADICTFGYEIDSPDGRCVRIPQIRNGIYSGKKVTEKFLPHFFGDDPADDELRGFSSCMSCFRADIIKENNISFPSEREYLSEDTVFCLEYCKHVKTAITVSDIFYHYCQKVDSFSQGYRPDKMEKTMKMLEVLKGYASSYGVEDIVKTRLSMYVWVNLMASLKQEVRHLDETLASKEYNDVSKDDIGISKKSIVNRTKKRIQELCFDREITDAAADLKRSKIPLKQKLLLVSFLNKDIPAVMLLCRIRSGIKM